MFSFQVLGPLEVHRGDQTRTPSAPKLRRVLALLLLRSNSVVSTESVIAELWEEPPASAMTTMQTYIYQLRKILNRGSQEIIVTKPPGYLLNLDPELLDARVCEKLIEQGNALLEQGRAREASERLTSALEMWRGTPLANTPCGGLLRAHVVHLEELRIRALESRIEADMRLGRERRLIAELRSLVATHPLNEWFHARLIEALYRAGRRGDALVAFQSLRHTLREELGLEPAGGLQRLQQEILSDRDPRVRPMDRPVSASPLDGPGPHAAHNSGLSTLRR